jgi:thiol peroxidase
MRAREFYFKILFMANITLGGNAASTNGTIPQPGDSLEDFKLVRSDMQEVSLADYQGKNLVLNIFPSVDTGVCAQSVRTFNKRVAGHSNTVVLNISMDLPFAQKRFCAAEGLEGVETLSDFRYHQIADNYQAKITDGAFAGLLSRAVIVANSGGKVVHSQQVSEIGEEPDYDAALKAVED